MKGATLHPHKSALIALILVFPFFVLNSIVGLHVETYFSPLWPSIPRSELVLAAMVFTLLLMPIALFIVVRPFVKADKRDRRSRAINIIVAALLATIMIPLWSGASAEIIACDVFNVPNCN